MTRADISNELNSIMDNLFGNYYGKLEDIKNPADKITLKSETGIRELDNAVSAVAKALPPVIGGITAFVNRKKQPRPTDFLLSEYLCDDDKDDFEPETCLEKQSRLTDEISEELDVVVLQRDFEKMKTFSDLIDYIEAEIIQ